MKKSNELNLAASPGEVQGPPASPGDPVHSERQLSESDAGEVREGLIGRVRELRRDARISHKGHHNAAVRWHNWHLLLGIPAAGLAAIIGVGASIVVSEEAGAVDVDKVLAVVGSLLAAVLTAMNPEKLSQGHKSAGDAIHALHNELKTLEAVSPRLDGASFEESFLSIQDRYHAACKNSPTIPSRCFRKAKKEVDQRERARVAARVV